MSKSKKLKQLRKLMAKQGLDAYIIPNTDPHQSEYIADHWKALTWLSNFTGSAGNLVITKDFAGLWTDSRYFIQAEAELKDTGFKLVKLKTPHVPEYIDWLAEQLPAKAKIGFDDSLFSIKLVRLLKSKLAHKKIKLRPTDLISKIYANRPSIPEAPIFIHKTRFAGLPMRQKLEAIREEMAKQGATHHLITTLDEIAWALNIRGRDVDFNPVAIAYLLIGPKTAHLFINKTKTTPKIRKKLIKSGVKLHDYDDIRPRLEKLNSGKRILLSPSKVNAALFDTIPAECEIIEGYNIAANKKAIKNPVEQQHIREVMVKDGVALLRFFRWLEAELETERPVTELSAAEALYQSREKEEGFIGNSFSTIAGFAGNGAIVHYRPSKQTSKTLEPDGIFLLDSGGQYLTGTTDITRTTCVGEPTEQQKRDYTLVLKGHIALAKLIFPENTKGYQMEVLARQALWSEGLNYGHGTGHGVGFFLNVHEGPQAFGTGLTANPHAGFKTGMLTSNEPGIYHADQYGIRIENLMLTIPAFKTEFGTFLKFETVTLFPIDTRLIALELMTETEKQWLNAYHLRVRETLWESLNDEERIWLVGKTREV